MLLLLTCRYCCGFPYESRDEFGILVQWLGRVWDEGRLVRHSVRPAESVRTAADHKRNRSHGRKHILLGDCQNLLYIFSVRSTL